MGVLILTLIRDIFEGHKPAHCNEPMQECTAHGLSAAAGKCASQHIIIIIYYYY